MGNIQAKTQFSITKWSNWRNLKLTTKTAVCESLSSCIAMIFKIEEEKVLIKLIYSSFCAIPSSNIYIHLKHINMTKEIINVIKEIEYPKRYISFTVSRNWKNEEKRYEKLMKLLGGCTGHPYLKFKLGFGGKTLQVSWLKRIFISIHFWFKIQVMQNHLKILLINAICVIWPDFSSFRVFKPRAVRSTNFMRFKSTRKSIDEVWTVLFSYSARQCPVPTQPSIKSDWTIDSIIWNFNWIFIFTKNYPKKMPKRMDGSYYKNLFT